MLSIILMVSVTMAGEPIPAQDHLECTEPQAGVEMQCWPAQRDHDSLDLCASAHGNDLDDALHVHVKPSEPVAMVDQAPWSEPEPVEAPQERSQYSKLIRADEQVHMQVAQPEPVRQPRGDVSVRVEGGNNTHRSSNVHVIAQPVYAVGTYAPIPRQASEAVTVNAVSDFRASQEWIGGVRAENATYQNLANEADERAAKAETARKAEEARRLAAQAPRGEGPGDRQEAAAGPGGGRQGHPGSAR